MLTDEAIDAIAQEYVRASHPPGWKILRREVRANPDGIYFFASVDGGHYGGPGGFFVTRAAGELWTFGSDQINREGLDYWLEFYADGWRIGAYRLTVLAAESPTALAQLLRQCGVSYQLREVEHSTVWARTVVAQIGEILDRLETLPCTFSVSGQALRAILPVLKADELGRVTYDYIGYPPRYDWRPENNTPDQLGRQW